MEPGKAWELPQQLALGSVTGSVLPVVEHISMTRALSSRGAQEIAPREPRFGEMMLDDVIEGPEQPEAGRFELPGEQGLLPGTKSTGSELDSLPGDLRQ